MKVLLTGATGYIGRRVLPLLVQAGHEVACLVRNKDRLRTEDIPTGTTVFEADLLDPTSLNAIQVGFDAAFYLVHSMSGNSADFDDLEARSAENFRELVQRVGVDQVIYLSGIVNAEELSKHLASRKQVETILDQGTFSLTVLRAAIIVGSGSASFEIIRDLVEKLPVMITPKWLLTRIQPIAIRDVLTCLVKVLGDKRTYDQSFDIGGADVLTYKDMLLTYANERGLKRYIMTLPVMTPRLSSYWLFFVTNVPYRLAVNLVNSMKLEVVCRDQKLQEMLGNAPITYQRAVQLALEKVNTDTVVSSWKDPLGELDRSDPLTTHISVPTHGCFVDHRSMPCVDTARSLERIWSVGGSTGWYHANWLWRIRGWMDRMIGGVGLRRGRTHQNKIDTGDALDFWRVLLADKRQARLLLFAEMKLPGEAWLEFKIDPEGVLHQTATFRPKGLLGRLYWFSVSPMHHIVFSGMLRKIAL